MCRMLGAAVLAAAVVLAMPQARADEVADFYRGKRINLIVSYGTGGGYDVYARVLAKHMSRHIPGSPNIIIQNMPGAGRITSTTSRRATAPCSARSRATSR
jgi:tripartite-type tricarboxylate transporter receptor subunit TctC